MLAVIGIERAVVVQPSVHGLDNSATLDAIKSLAAILAASDGLTTRRRKTNCGGSTTAAFAACASTSSIGRAAM